MNTDVLPSRQTTVRLDRLNEVIGLRGRGRDKWDLTLRGEPLVECPAIHAEELLEVSCIVKSAGRT